MAPSGPGAMVLNIYTYEKGPLVEDSLDMPGVADIIPLWFDVVGVVGGVLALAMTVLALVLVTRGESRTWFRALSRRPIPPRGIHAP